MTFYEIIIFEPDKNGPAQRGRMDQPPLEAVFLPFLRM
jgi:hypothetical protein